VFYLIVSGVHDGSVTDGTGEGLIIDDDAPPPASPCVGGTMIAKPRFAISGLGDQPGNERLSFRGKLKFAPGMPAGMTPLDSIGHGAQVLIEDLGSGASAIFDLTQPNGPVPAGAMASVCQAGVEDGWIVNATSTGYTYKNNSGALAPGCV